MAYQFESRVRYSEIDWHNRLTWLSLINYFQDCSTFHSEACGKGMGYLVDQRRVWMVLSWQIEIVRRPVLGEKIISRTWPTGFKAFYGYRNFVLLDEQEQVLARANSVWVYIDLETGKPSKVLPENISGYECEPPIEMKEVSRKIQIPEGCEKKEPILVQRHHIDTNYHVNNGQYIYMAEEFLPADFEATGLRVEYRKQARLHDTIIPMVHSSETDVTVCLCDEEEKPYAIVVFEREN